MYIQNIYTLINWEDNFKAEPEIINNNSVKQQTLLASAWKDYLQP